MKGELKMDVNEYLPLRDGTGRETYGNPACQ